jgi:ABC-type antimicrobial peptide transport system permease subunit
MGNTFVPIGAGVLVGIAGALAAGRYLESQLFEVKTNDPVSFVAGASLLAAIALLATYIPARRAARANPAATLRCE